MIVGIGCDIVQIDRFKGQQNQWKERILTEREKELYSSFPQNRQRTFLAGRFAAKEALIKALDIPVSMKSLEILPDPQGKPTVHIEGYKIHLSISHEKEYAIGYALVEREYE